MTLYHCSPLLLELGSIIRPGNYGRVLKMYGARHDHWLREQFLEFIRAQEFPDKPSRLTSAFTCEQLDAIELFKGRNCESGVIYEVELVDPDANSHTTDFNCVQPIPGVIEDMCEISRHYWNASYWLNISDRPGLKCSETLVETGLMIIRQIE